MHQLSADGIASLRYCFSPASAAIIGASTNPMKFGGRALKFCLERGYRGRLYPINVSHDMVQGVPAFRTISDVPEPPDIAVIAVPAAQVRANLIAAAEKGCRAAVVYGAQFAEAGGSGRAQQDELLRIARSNGVRMIGPNCMGTMSLISGFVASFTSAPEHFDGNGWPKTGSVSVASQSGAIGIQIFAQLRDRGIGLANWISTGNQADIDVADAIAFFAGDAATKTITAYFEDASRGLKLVQALELARRARKPVIALKVGTTPEGGQAAAGHTASLYVEDAAVRDLFTQYGVLRAHSINELIDLTAACNAGPPPAAPEVAAVSVSGGGAVMISDIAAKLGLRLADYPADALAELKQTNSFVNDRNPIDISAPSMSDMAITGGHLKWGLERRAPAMIGYISHVPLVPRTRSAIMPQLLSFRDAHKDQLIAIAGNFHPEDRKALVETGLAVFDDPAAATMAVAKAVHCGQAFQKPPTEPAAPGEQGDLVSLLESAGIVLAPESAVESADEAIGLLDGPIVLKLAAPSLKHRTELGGVEINLTDASRVSRAFKRLAKLVIVHREQHPDIRITASPQIDGVEVLLGVRNDPHFGPLVILGSGGTDCRLFADLVCRKPPFGPADARSMVTSLRVAPKFAGWRGRPAVSRAALEQALAAVSNLAHLLPDFEINPLMVTPEGVVGVDLIRTDHGETL